MLGVGEIFLLIFAVLIFCAKTFGIPQAFAVASLLIALYLWYLKENKSYWIRRGIAGPKPNLFFGNALEFFDGLHALDERREKNFGETYGSFLFNVPELTSTNLDLLREVLVKKFEHFSDRISILNNDPEDPHSLLANSLVTLKGSTWSSVRATVAPAFSTAKIRKMIPTLNESSQICVEIFKDFAKRKEKVPIRETMVRLMLDMTSKAAFGRDFNVQHDVSSTFINYAKKYAEFDFRSPRIVAITLFPNICWILKKLTGYSILNNETNRYFVEILDHLYENRIDNKENYEYKDFFQLMLSAMKNEDDEKREIDREIEFEITAKTSQKGILKQHIFGQAFMFILAGFETGPINLHLTVYMLAMHTEWQDRVRNEINMVLKDKEPDYLSLAELPLLEQCIHETQRLFPAVVRLNRMCTKPVELNGVLMPKGSVFSIPVYNIHHSEKFYDKPEEFKPERWSPSEKATRDPLTFLPFGHGPRNCIGMRVGQFQMRSALVHLIRNFRLTVADGSPKTLPLEIDTRGSFRTVSPLYINVERIED